MAQNSRRAVPKYQQVLEALEKPIASGQYKAGHKLPSEASLVRRFGTSRITVGHALNELARKGLVVRRPGSGTYVSAAKATGMLFGLLVPNLGDTEIFEPICRGMTQAPHSKANALLWGHSTGPTSTKAEEAWHLCRQYISRRVSGVFFAPLELAPGCERANRGIIAALEDAGIPVVLLDRHIESYPERGKHDLVGIDNHKTGYMITEHLLELGCQRVVFLAHPNSASTIPARISGFWSALLARGMTVEKGAVQLLDPTDVAGVRKMMETVRPNGLVCGNDRTAGHLMRTLISLGYRIPDDVRIVGIDDVKYAMLLPVPLTTAHQPCRQIGEVAMMAMLERLERPDIPARDILLDCRLVIRDSCGAKLSRTNKSATEVADNKSSASWEPSEHINPLISKGR